MKNKLSIENFSFGWIGYGHYEVTYTSPVTNKKWSKIITDMEMIDNIKNADCVKKADLEILKYIVKDTGAKHLYR